MTARWIELKKKSSLTPHYRSIKAEDGLFFPYVNERFRVDKRLRIYTYKTSRLPGGEKVTYRAELHQFGIRRRYRRYWRWERYHPGKYDRMIDIRFYGSMPVKHFSSETAA